MPRIDQKNKLILELRNSQLPDIACELNKQRHVDGKLLLLFWLAARGKKILRKVWGQLYLRKIEDSRMTCDYDKFKPKKNERNWEFDL